MKKKMKTGTIILIIICFVGLCALLYPSIANYWNENFVAHAVTEYVHTLEKITDEEYQRYWEEAIDYNQRLAQSGDRVSFYQDHIEEYMSCLDTDRSGVLGYIDIPKINVSLPLYHTTSSDVLAMAIGHLEWTSLPTGGPGTHCCFSGHRGLASARLFTNLSVLREGDQFTLTVMNEVLTYEVDQIRTVLPTEVNDLAIDPEHDYCTLITCTPYGINTHRLLVRGHRVATASAEVHVIAEAVLIDNRMVAMFLAIPILFLLVLAVMLKKPEKKPVKKVTAASLSKSEEVKNVADKKS